ncbi:unnamed protein product [Caenorhabditis auriculariae]|uniref:Uncharacterized protein n=1 Tax=Caenorhabditis auriculariae TaxID=2777116 RepID=A0A8S1H7L0_9PELO|nr:unnamed protein product [Caenorhabditis auriculariae]
MTGGARNRSAKRRMVVGPTTSPRRFPRQPSSSVWQQPLRISLRGPEKKRGGHGEGVQKVACFLLLEPALVRLEPWMEVQKTFRKVSRLYWLDITSPSETGTLKVEENKEKTSASRSPTLPEEESSFKEYGFGYSQETSFEKTSKIYEAVLPECALGLDIWNNSVGVKKRRSFDFRIFSKKARPRKNALKKLRQGVRLLRSRGESTVQLSEASNRSNWRSRLSWYPRHDIALHPFAYHPRVAGFVVDALDTAETHPPLCAPSGHIKDASFGPYWDWRYHKKGKRGLRMWTLLGGAVKVWGDHLRGAQSGHLKDASFGPYWDWRYHKKGKRGLRMWTLLGGAVKVWGDHLRGAQSGHLKDASFGPYWDWRYHKKGKRGLRMGTVLELARNVWRDLLRGSYLDWRYHKKGKKGLRMWTV